MSKAALSGKYAAYPEYKDSDVEWLGGIPNHWNLKPIKYIFKIENGSTPKSGISEYWDGDITWITPSDLSKISTKFISSSSRCITFAGFNSCGTSLTPKNSLVISSRAPIGSLAITTKESCTNQGCKSLVPKSKNNNIIYTYYVFSIATEQLNLLGRGTTFLELSSDDLGKFSIPYPPLNEQTQIAAFLDHETAKIDTLIGKQQQLIELLKEKRQAVISHAVTKGLTPDAPMKYSGVEWLGEVPEHWDVKKIKHFGRVIGGFAFKSGDFIKQGYPVIKITNVSHLTMSFNELAYLPETFAHDNSEYIAPPNSLVFAMTRPIIAGGIKVAKMPKLEKMPLINQRVGFLKIEDENLTDYILFSSLSNSFIAQFKNNMTITNQPNISSEGIESVSFPFPPKDELKEITAYLVNNENKFDSLIKKSKEQVHLLTERRTALISAAVTGKIDVRHWVAPATSSDTNKAQQEVTA